MINHKNFTISDVKFISVIKQFVEYDKKIRIIYNKLTNKQKNNNHIKELLYTINFYKIPNVHEILNDFFDTDGEIDDREQNNYNLFRCIINHFNILNIDNEEDKDEIGDLDKYDHTDKYITNWSISLIKLFETEFTYDDFFKLIKKIRQEKKDLLNEIRENDYDIYDDSLDANDIHQMNICAGEKLFD